MKTRSKTMREISLFAWGNLLQSKLQNCFQEAVTSFKRWKNELLPRFTVCSKNGIAQECHRALLKFTFEFNNLGKFPLCICREKAWLISLRPNHEGRIMIGKYFKKKRKIMETNKRSDTITDTFHILVDNYY